MQLKLQGHVRELVSEVSENVKFHYKRLPTTDIGITVKMRIIMIQTGLEYPTWKMKHDLSFTNN